MLTERELRKGLKTKIFGSKIYTFQTIDSTKNCAKTMAGVGAPEGVVVIAEEQTSGKGRLGRTWQANAGENLTLSIVLRPKVVTDAMNLLPLYVAIVAADAIETSTHLKVECKWPNDLLINKKKVGGVLIEGAIREGQLDYAVVGLGLNVNQLEFPSDLLHKASSLRLEANKEIDRLQLFRDILTTLESSYKTAVASAFQTVVASWIKRSVMLNKPIAVSQRGNIITGVVKGLSTDGGLILQTNGTLQTFFAGDVTILGEAPEQLFPLGNTSTTFVDSNHS